MTLTVHTLAHRFLREPKKLLLAFVGLCLVLLAAPAGAQVCLTTAVAPVFGNYVSANASNTSNGSVTVSCLVLGVIGQTVAYTIKLDPGSHATGTQRRMGNGTSFLNYNVYCDAGYNTIWGDGTGTTCVNSGGQAGLIGNLVNVYPVYGKIPGGQYVAPGTYTDAIAITVLY